MALITQIQTLIVSFIYGICFAYLLVIQYKYLFESKLFIKILFTFLFLFDSFLIYFLLLRIINNGVFHYYFGIMLVLGYLFGYKLIYRKNVKR